MKELQEDDTVQLMDPAKKSGQWLKKRRLRKDISPGEISDYKEGEE